MRKLSVAIILSVLLVGCGNGGTAIQDSGPTSGSGAGPSAGLTGKKSAVLSWAASKGSPQGYKIEESTDGTNFSQVQLVSDATATTTVVSELFAGQSYYFRIRAFNQGGNSAYTVVKMVIP